MREISTEPIKIGEHVLIDGEEYLAEEANGRVCDSCVLEKSHKCYSIPCDNVIFKKVGEDLKYEDADIGEQEKAWVARLREGLEYLKGEMDDIAEDFERIPKEDVKARLKNMELFFKREKARDEIVRLIRMLESGQLQVSF